MLARPLSLHRYILGDFKSLEPAELDKLKHFFREHVDVDNAELQAFIYQYNREHPMVNDIKPFEPTQEFLSIDDAELKHYLESFDAQYRYFADENARANALPLYKALVKLIQLMNIVTKTDDAEHATLKAYIVLVLFGNKENNIEKTLQLFESYYYCELQPQQSAIATPKNFPFELRQRKKPLASTDLAAWRALVPVVVCQEALQIFYIAEEIQDRLQRVPNNLSEAKKFAREIQFAAAELCPDLAAFCVRLFIPEEYFIKCIAVDPASRQMTYGWMMQRLPAAEKLNFLRNLPRKSLNFGEILALVPSNIPKDQEAEFVKAFATDISAFCAENFDNILILLETITSENAKEFLLKEIPTDALLNDIPSKNSNNPMHQVDVILTNLDPNLQNLLLRQFFQNQKFRQFFTTFQVLQTFLDRHAPAENRTDFFVNIVGVAATRALMDTSAYMALILTAPDMSGVPNRSESYALLKAIYRPEQFVQRIGKSPGKLVEILDMLPKLDRYDCCVEWYGLNNLRTLLTEKHYRDVVARQLEHGEGKKFLDIFRSPEEIAARKEIEELEKVIIDTKFTKGYLGFFYPITLPDGTNKSVPRTVKDHWETIQQVIAEKMEPVAAWKSIQKSGAEAAAAATESTYNPFTLTRVYTRGKESNEYLTRFVPPAPSRTPSPKP